ncbi:hypothetical protein N0V95_009050 [Ascochyta clinopodiicola]|nr:hypothetical protein N0V95_009050 [Ascochyta clinopodiicola]
MRSFQNIVVFLFALVACVFAAQDTESYDATVYLTSTVYRVNTVTLSGSPSSAVANQTSTIHAPSASASATFVAPGSYGTNGTSVKPTGSATKPTSTSVEFTGAASSLHANALVVVLAAGVGYLVL